jgi:hypothetical protein
MREAARGCCESPAPPAPAPASSMRPVEATGRFNFSPRPLASRTRPMRQELNTGLRLLVAVSVQRCRHCTVASYPAAPRSPPATSTTTTRVGPSGACPWQAHEPSIRPLSRATDSHPLAADWSYLLQRRRQAQKGRRNSCANLPAPPARVPRQTLAFGPASVWCCSFRLESKRALCTFGRIMCTHPLFVVRYRAPPTRRKMLCSGSPPA